MIRSAGPLTLFSLLVLPLAAHSSASIAQSARTIPVGKGPGPIAVDIRSGHVFVANGKSTTVSMLDGSTGNVVRTTNLKAAPSGSSSIGIDTRTGHAFVSNGPNISMLDTRTGAILHTSNTGNAVAIGVDERISRVFAVTAGDILSVLDSHSGSIVHLHAAKLGKTAGNATGEITIDSHTNRILIPDATNHVSVIDALTGKILHTVAVGKNPISMAVDEATGHAFVCNNGSDSVSMLDASSGHVLHTTHTSTPALVTVDQQTSRAFVLNGDGGVTVLNTQTGTVAHALPSGTIGLAVAAAVDQHKSRVFVTDSLGNKVSVIDGSTGRLLRMIPVGNSPDQLAIDEQTGRAFIVNYQDNTVSVVNT